MAIRSTLMIGLSMALVGVASACSGDAADSLGTRRGPAGTTNPDGTPADANDPNSRENGGAGTPHEEALFRALEAELGQKCGGTCHTDGTYTPTPPKFLAPEAYKSIKAHPGIVVPDVYQSTLLTKGPHAGPAMDVDPVFEKKVVDWLTAESLAISVTGNPSTDPVSVVAGPNDVDLTKAASGGLTGVRLKFDASVVGGMLSLSNMKIVAPAGTDVHVVKPKFIRVLEAPVDDRKEFADPADSFSNTDQTVPGGAETILQPGSVFFSGDGWKPFDLSKDKLRITADKIEPGKVQVVEPPKTCKNVALFTSNVLPSLRGGNGFTPNCQSCHGNGLAGLNLASQDTALICNQVLVKLNQANIAQSQFVTKVTVGPHNGGTVNDAAAWTALFTDNAAAFF